MAEIGMVYGGYSRPSGGGAVFGPGSHGAIPVTPDISTIQSLLGGGSSRQSNGVTQGVRNPFYGDPNGANYKAWEAAHGGGSAGGGSSSSSSSSGSGTGQSQVAPSPVPMTPGSPVVNKAEANPIATENINRLQERAKGDMGLGRELDRGIQDIRHNALAGIRGDQMSRVSRGLGGGGSSIDEYDAAKQTDQERMDVNRMVNDRTIAAEAMRNDLLGSTANLALNTSGQQLQAQGQAASQANAQSALDLQRQAQANSQQNEAFRLNLEAQNAQRNAQLQNFQTLLNLFS